MKQEDKEVIDGFVAEWEMQYKTPERIKVSELKLEQALQSTREHEASLWRERIKDAPCPAGWDEQSWWMAREEMINTLDNYETK